MLICDRKGPRLVPEMAQSLLLIERNRIVNFGANALVETVPQECVTVFGEHHVQVVDAFFGGAARRNANLSNLVEMPIVKRGVLDALRCDLRHRVDQPVANDRLQRIESRIVAEDVNGIAIPQTVVAQELQAVGYCTSVTTTPPSPQMLRFFRGCSENPAATPQVPARFPSKSARMAWHASSTTASP
jgi:hypothetical protein